ncbi:MAG: pilin, partial [Patescibacteria group bacterium]
ETGDTTAVIGTVCCIEEVASFGKCPAGSECSLGLTCFPKEDYNVVGKCGSSSSPKTCCQKKVHSSGMTSADCISKSGYCATVSGCDKSKFESAIGTCEGMVSCCKLDPILVAAAKKAVKPTAPPTDLSVLDPLKGADLPILIGRVISTFLGMVGAASLLVFVYAGVRYLTAGGSEEAVKIAKDTMKYAFIGLFLIIFAYVITNFFFTALTK